MLREDRDIDSLLTKGDAKTDGAWLPRECQKHLKLCPFGGRGAGMGPRNPPSHNDAGGLDRVFMRLILDRQSAAPLAAG